MNVRRTKRSAAGGALAALGAGLLASGGVLMLAPSAAADPPGNNGFVKVDDQAFDDIPNNDPHVGCNFRVDFYNFDKGDFDATVLFEMRPPTADVDLTVSGDTTPFIGGDDAGGGNDADAQVPYTLSFDGDPHPQQGYHVKLTINAPGSKGRDVKHKVFWVEGCDAEPPTEPPTDEPPTDEPPTDEPPTDEPPTDEPPTDEPPTDEPTTTPTDEPGTTPTDEPGTGPQSSTPPAVPTAVDAGLSGGDTGGSSSGLGLGLMLIGVTLAGAGGALVARGRGGAHKA